MAGKATPLRILCIHGYRQNSAGFRQKLGAFRKAVGKRAEFVFIDAPLVVPSASGEGGKPGEDAGEERGWWFSAEGEISCFNALEETKICPGFEASVRAIAEAEAALGPFDGILGFSQGAAMVGLYLAGAQQSSFKFVIFVASFKSKSEAHRHLYDASHKISIPSLHVYGDTDGVIPKPMSIDFLEIFEDPQSLNHPGGHFVPAAGPQKAVFNKFLDDMASKLKTT